MAAQDVIHVKNKKESIQAKVIEIGTGEIKYKLWDERENGLVYVLEKMGISHIEFENGRTEYYGQETMDAEEYFIGQNKRAGKVSFLGPMVGHTTLTYEQNIKPGRSWEVKATIAGLGVNQEENNSKGLIASFGYKLYKKPTYVTSDLRRRHILQGGYLKPEVFVGHTSFNDGYYRNDGERKSSGTVGLLLNFGKQWVLGDNFVFNTVYGIGYGGGESYSAYIVTNEGHVAMTFAMEIGWAF